MTDQMLWAHPDGNHGYIDPSFEEMQRVMDGATLSYCPINDDIGFYVDDNGMLDGADLNVPASLYAGQPLYGPVILIARRPDDEGNSLPANDLDDERFHGLVDRWRVICERAKEVGQSLSVKANPDTVPPPLIVPLDMDQWLRDLEGS